MKCFLHIGTEKTATTYIQKFLDLNRCKLLENGFIFTKSAGQKNDLRLPVAAYNLKRRDDLTKTFGIDSDSELSNFQNKIIYFLKEEIKEVASLNLDLIILFSSEHFQSRLTELEEIQRLKEILYSLGINEISVIVYLRNPAEIANSLFSTSIKYGYNLGGEPPSPKQPYYANICNHQNTLVKFESVFGESALIPKIFHETEFKNESIIDDFLEVIGAPLDSAYSIPTNRNKSLSITGINILRRINKFVPRFIEGKLNPLRADIIFYIEKYYSDSKYVMPSYLFEQYDLEFHESNEWVRKKYFPGKRSLFPEVPYPKESKLDIPDRELDRMANLIANIWIDKQYRIMNLARRST